MAQINHSDEFDDATVGKVLRGIAYLNDGRINVDDLLGEANNSRSPLHKHFEWEVAKGASERMWRSQARDLIERCTVKLPVEPFTDDPPD